MPRILAFSGSLSKNSLNLKLVKISATAAETAGADMTLLSLGDYPLPVYNKDLITEGKIPENAIALKEIFRRADGFLIASPEHMGMFSTALKNLFDWAGFSEDENNSYLDLFNGKIAGVMSVCSRISWGVRSLVQLRMFLQNIGILVLPHQCCIGSPSKEFIEKGVLNKVCKDSVLKIGKQVTEILARLKDPPFPFFQQ